MFKDRLKQLRKDNNLTQETLANVICVSRSAINKWEQGNGIPSDVNLKSLCKYFNVSEEWLLDREDLKVYIKNDSKHNKLSLIISIVGIILPILFILLTFLGFFSFKCSSPNACLLIYIPPKSIFDYLGAGVILPIIIYSITLSISFINIIQIVKEEKTKKLVITNLIFILISLLLFITTFTIASFIAVEDSFGIF